MDSPFNMSVELSNRTAMTLDDVITTLEDQNMLVKYVPTPISSPAPSQRTDCTHQETDHQTIKVDEELDQSQVSTPTDKNARVDNLCQGHLSNDKKIDVGLIPEVSSTQRNEENSIQLHMSTEKNTRISSPDVDISLQAHISTDRNPGEDNTLAVNESTIDDAKNDNLPHLNPWTHQNASEKPPTSISDVPHNSFLINASESDFQPAESPGTDETVKFDSGHSNGGSSSSVNHKVKIQVVIEVPSSKLLQVSSDYEESEAEDMPTPSETENDTILRSDDVNMDCEEIEDNKSEDDNTMGQEELDKGDEVAQMEEQSPANVVTVTRSGSSEAEISREDEPSAIPEAVFIKPTDVPAQSTPTKRRPGRPRTKPLKPKEPVSSILFNDPPVYAIKVDMVRMRQRLDKLAICNYPTVNASLLKWTPFFSVTKSYLPSLVSQKL
jgi:hypothetical protein